MNAIVAVYSDWGIGANGTQPVTVSADRKRFRELTRGAAVIVGRRTLADFPGGRPLRDRVNIVLSRSVRSVEGAIVVSGADEALAEASKYEACFVIGGASVYREMLPYIDRVFVTQIDCAPASDSFFPNLEEDGAWFLADAEPWQEENGIRYRFCVFSRRDGGALRAEGMKT